MKIVITGGAGFVGSQVGYYFHKLGHDVFLVDNMSYGKKDNLIIDGSRFGTFIKADIREKDTDEVYQSADLVLHFAGIAPLPDCQINPENAYDNNVLGTIRVLEGCRKASVPKIVFASTSAIYENCKEFPLEEENVDQEPNLIYSMSKRSCELICKSYVENYGMDITTLRFFNVYGPHQDFKRKHPPLMGYITKSLLENAVPTFFSEGDQKRDYVYTEDISKMITAIIKTPASKGEIFNVCSEKAHSVREIYELYRAHFKNSKDPQFKKSEEFWDKYPGLFEGDYPLEKDRVVKEVNKYSLGSYSKAKRLLGWEPSVTMEEGVGKCVKYAVGSSSDKTPVKFDFVEIGSSCFKTLAEVFRGDDSMIGLSIEPVPELYSAIKDFCQDSKNKHFLRCAVVENKTEDFINFYHTVGKEMQSISEAGIGSASKQMIDLAIRQAAFGVNSKIKTISVPAMTFQEVIDKYKIDEIGFLKIDTEGFDYSIVKSVLKSGVKVQTILFEADPFMTKEQKQEILSLLEREKFVVTKCHRDFHCQKTDSEWTLKRCSNISSKYINKNNWLKKIDHANSVSRGN